jgi:hypothetical protein
MMKVLGGLRLKREMLLVNGCCHIPKHAVEYGHDRQTNLNVLSPSIME